MEIPCAICFDDLFTDEESIYSTKCGHVFHHQCIVQWTESSSTCPNCRQNVTIDGILKLNVQVNIEEASIAPAPSSMNKRVTRSSVKNSPRTRSNVLQSELGLKNSQLELKVKELSLKSIELQRMEKMYNTSKTENDQLRLENDKLQKEISKLKSQLQLERERSVIIRSDLRIMDIIDLDQDRDQFNEERENLIDLTTI